jgi:hypothetical protein
MTSRMKARRADPENANPSEVFKSPSDVLEREDLSYETKLDILQRWQTRLQDGPDDRDWVDDIALAIEQLQNDVALDPEKPESAPSSQGYRPKD